jgi:hypothetical protein
MVRGLRSYSWTASMGSVSMFTAISVVGMGAAVIAGARRRGGPPHMRWVRGSVDRWLAGWVARAVGTVRGRRFRPNLARYGPRRLATGSPTLAHGAFLAATATNPARRPPRARTGETNSVAKRGCSRGPGFAATAGKYLLPPRPSPGRGPAVRLPLGAAWHATCMGAAGTRGTGEKDSGRERSFNLSIPAFRPRARDAWARAGIR